MIRGRGDRLKNRLYAALAFCLLIVFCFRSAEVAEGARIALELCASSLLPSLFPFFALSILLSRIGAVQRLGRRIAPAAEKLFGVSGAGAAVLPVGLLGGYPLGAAAVAELCGQRAIGRREAEHLLLFVNNSGPAFLIGAIGGGVFASRSAGAILYASHLLSALFVGVLFRFRSGSAGTAPKELPSGERFSAAFSKAVGQAVSAVLNVCGFAVLFSVLCGLFVRPLLNAVPDSCLPQASVAALGFFEIGGAVGAMRGLQPTPAHLALASAVVGWGGLSVHCQTAALFAELELSLKKHLLGRLLSGALSAAITFALASCFF
ncbi:MAG: hypothetical protein K6G17_03125 [Oscillospiraceae bacterium]|nr:hypothetical protein [Oscillospiraceae bacterium]